MLKQLLSVLLVLCLLGNCCLFAYASQIDREFNTQPGSVSPDGQAILDQLPALKVACWIAGVLLVLSIAFLIYTILTYRKSRQELFQFRIDRGWVPPVSNVHICAKISLWMLLASCVLPIFLFSVSLAYVQTIDNISTFSVLDALLGSSLLSLFIVYAVSFIGFILAIIGICKSKRKAGAVVACILHGLPLLSFIHMA
jgi:hypothetical protein